MAELNQLEQFLRQPDAVMEPAILEKLRSYVGGGGNPRDVVEMLSDNYVGESCNDHGSFSHQQSCTAWDGASSVRKHALAPAFPVDSVL